jgi:3-hydroxyisobutyrate dehydrogenase-like beta-hydroxyacid dehydrogenase
MQIGFVGLGRMGGNMVRRLMKAGHKCVVFDISADARKALAGDGAVDAASLEKLVEALAGEKRAVWVMLPAGKITETTVENSAACSIRTISSSMAATASTRTTSAAPRRLPPGVSATSIAARPAASGASIAVIA